MAQHKAPTQVSIVTEEKSKFAQFVERWMMTFFVGFGLVAVFVVWQAMQGQKERESVGTEWLAIHQARIDVDLDESTQALRDAMGSEIEPYVRLTHLQIAGQANRKDIMGEEIAKLAQGDNPVLNRMTFPIGEDGAEITLAQRVSVDFAAQQAWEAEYGILTNPAPPEGSPEVVLETTAGVIRIALYQEAAPNHTANLLARVRDGYYDGLCFSRVIDNRSLWTIQTGDPESRNTEDITAWGRENGPEGIEPIAKEDTGLVHDEGYLSMDVVPGTQESSAGQFLITLRPAYALDQGQVCFGKVIEGLDVAKTIGEGEIRPTEEGAQTLFAPIDPIVITKASVFE